MTRLRMSLLILVAITVLGAVARAGNAPPLWILQKNRRAAEQYQRDQVEAATVPASARTPTLAVPTPIRLDP